MESARDVIGFYQRTVEPFRAADSMAAATSTDTVFHNTSSLLLLWRAGLVSPATLFNALRLALLERGLERLSGLYPTARTGAAGQQAAV